MAVQLLSQLRLAILAVRRRREAQTNPMSTNGQALAYAGLEGLEISTHSFSRTALTNLSNAGVPLRVIQEISDYRSLASLQRYLEVSPEQKKAIAGLNYLEFMDRFERLVSS
ncbi:tyrosine-type recombinase/integrase [Nodosilinea sp. LEGE 06152]|uniref:tyrosine-type recombinase/integrase n=1 Tax=Nodosilinea sp. LEGE 06152 TaxID=2777966 RepID=UPI003242A47B